MRFTVVPKDVIHRTDCDEIAAYLSEGWKIEGSVHNGSPHHSPVVYLSRSADAVVPLPALRPCAVCGRPPTEGTVPSWCGSDLPTVGCCTQVDVFSYTQRLARERWNERQVKP